jgi:hypothetical protein
MDSSAQNKSSKAGLNVATPSADTLLLKLSEPVGSQVSDERRRESRAGMLK